MYKKIKTVKTTGKRKSNQEKEEESKHSKSRSHFQCKSLVQFLLSVWIYWMNVSNLNAPIYSACNQ